MGPSRKDGLRRCTVINLTVNVTSQIFATGASSLLGKRGTALQAAVGAPIDPDPTAHGRPSNAPLIRASVCWGQANDTQTSSPSASPLAATSPSPRSVATRHRARVWRDAQKCREMGRRAGAMALPIAPSLHPTPPFLPLIPSPTSLHLVLARVPADFCLLAAALRGETLPFKPLHCPSPSLPSQSALPYSALLAALGCSLVPTRVSPPPPPPSAGSERLA